MRTCSLIQTLLPLAKLCAMVTMKKPEEPSVQTFSLQLTSLLADEADQLDLGKVGADCDFVADLFLGLLLVVFVFFYNDAFQRLMLHVCLDLNSFRLCSVAPCRLPSIIGQTLLR